MASYRVFVRSSAERELRHVPKPDLRRIVSRIRALAEDPTPPGSLKLQGETRYRIRQGDWRILYQVDRDSKTVDIGHRREVYR